MSNRAERFHFTRYELLWQPRENQQPVRVQGELYTSPAFLDAHKELQMLPGEPGCNRPRVSRSGQMLHNLHHLATPSSGLSIYYLEMNPNTIDAGPLRISVNTWHTSRTCVIDWITVNNNKNSASRHLQRLR